MELDQFDRDFFAYLVAGTLRAIGIRAQIDRLAVELSTKSAEDSQGLLASVAELKNQLRYDERLRTAIYRLEDWLQKVKLQYALKLADRRVYALVAWDFQSSLQKPREVREYIGFSRVNFDGGATDPAEIQSEIEASVTAITNFKQNILDCDPAYLGQVEKLCRKIQLYLKEVADYALTS